MKIKTQWLTKSLLLLKTLNVFRSVFRCTQLHSWSNALTPASCCLLCLLFVYSSAVYARDSSSNIGNVIHIGGDHNYPPYEFINADGQPDGYNTELTLAIAEVMGFKVDIQLGDWDTVLTKLKNSEIDAVQGMIISPERSKFFDFSPAHAIIHQSIFGRKGQTKITNLTELTDKEVIVQRSGYMHDYLIQQGIHATLILVDTHADALRLLASGKHDYALVANLPGLYLGRELELSSIVPVGKAFGSLHYGYSVTKGNDELLAQFSEGLAILKNTGRHQEIYDKWLGSLENQGFAWQRVGQITVLASALLLVLLAGIIVWNRMLTREVNRRTDELKIQQQQLIQADKMTSLGILVSGVAHEINNPSSMLLLNLPVIQDAYRDITPILEEHFNRYGEFELAGLEYSRMREELPLMLEDMLMGAQRIRSIVNDLRDFARQEPSDLNETVNLNDITATAIRLVDNTIRNATHHFTVNYEATVPTFQGSSQRIEQVVINLILNACQALENKEQAITIKTYYQPAKGIIGLQVIDQGRGIEQAHLSQICDPFFTTKREEGGTGLGLPISATIVREHGGQLTFTSQSGHGTRATVLLPLSKETPLT